MSESSSSPKTSSASAALFPAHAYERQEAIFAAAFEVLRGAIAKRAFPSASIAITSHGKLVALKAFGRFTYEADSPQVTAASVAAILVELGGAKGASPLLEGLRVSLTAGTIVLSWFFVHLMFAIHYAHVYYLAEETDTATHRGGLRARPGREHQELRRGEPADREGR